MDDEVPNGRSWGSTNGSGRCKPRARLDQDLCRRHASTGVACHSTPDDPGLPVKAEPPESTDSRYGAVLAANDPSAQDEARWDFDGLPEWIVLVEAAADDKATFLDLGTARAILELMGDETGVCLHCPDRIAVQVRVRAADAAESLSVALSRWRVAAVGLVPGGWNIVRAEVLTPDEFKRDCEGG